MMQKKEALINKASFYLIFANFTQITIAPV